MVVVMKGFVFEYYNGYVMKYMVGYSNIILSWNMVEDSIIYVSYFYLLIDRQFVKFVIDMS